MDKIKTELKQKKESLTKEHTIRKKEWVKPTLEDVSERVMAQPYIRFT